MVAVMMVFCSVVMAMALIAVAVAVAAIVVPARVAAVEIVTAKPAGAAWTALAVMTTTSPLAPAVMPPDQKLWPNQRSIVASSPSARAVFASFLANALRPPAV